jgi:hypothetical protein
MLIVAAISRDMLKAYGCKESNGTARTTCDFVIQFDFWHDIPFNLTFTAVFAWKNGHIIQAASYHHSGRSTNLQLNTRRHFLCDDSLCSGFHSRKYHPSETLYYKEHIYFRDGLPTIAELRPSVMFINPDGEISNLDADKLGLYLLREMDEQFYLIHSIPLLNLLGNTTIIIEFKSYPGFLAYNATKTLGTHHISVVNVMITADEDEAGSPLHIPKWGWWVLSGFMLVLITVTLIVGLYLLRRQRKLEEIEISASKERNWSTDDIMHSYRDVSLLQSRPVFSVGRPSLMFEDATSMKTIHRDGLPFTD